MNTSTRTLSLLAILASVAGVLPAQERARATAPVTLEPATRLDVINGQVSWVQYRGRAALRLDPRPEDVGKTDLEISAVVAGSDFTDGVIEIDVAGARRAGYSASDAAAFKGFIGLSFRVRGDTAERFYLRTENARLESQLFRNRSVQYEASPDHNWQRLRQESPAQYETYVDLEPGAWTSLRIEVSGAKARLFVNGATQPTLVVNDLKLGTRGGAIALWTRVSAEAHFSNLRVTRR